MSSRGKTTVRLSLLLALSVPGCQWPLNYEKTAQMSVGDVQVFPVEAPKRDQKIAVAVSSSNGPVNVYVVLEKDQEAAKRALLDGRKPANSLGDKEKMQEATIEATIPAKNGFVVMLGGVTKDTT